MVCNGLKCVCMFSSFLYVRNLGAMQVGPLVQGVLQVCNQGVQWGCNFLEFYSKISHVAIGRFSSLPAVRWRASVSHRPLWPSLVLCHMSIHQLPTWQLASIKCARGGQQDRVRVFCDLILDVTTLHDCHILLVKMGSLGPAYSQGNRIRQEHEYRRAVPQPTLFTWPGACKTWDPGITPAFLIILVP